MARLSGCSRCQQFLNNIKFQQKQPVVALYQPMLGKYKTKSKKNNKTNQTDSTKNQMAASVY